MERSETENLRSPHRQACIANPDLTRILCLQDSAAESDDITVAAHRNSLVPIPGSDLPEFRSTQILGFTSVEEAAVIAFYAPQGGAD